MNSQRLRMDRQIDNQAGISKQTEEKIVMNGGKPDRGGKKGEKDEQRDRKRDKQIDKERERETD